MIIYLHVYFPVYLWASYFVFSISAEGIHEKIKFLWVWPVNALSYYELSMERREQIAYFEAHISLAVWRVSDQIEVILSISLFPKNIQAVIYDNMEIFS